MLGHSLSFRDLEELLTERGLEGDDYLALGSAPSWNRAVAPSSQADRRVDEIYIRVKGRWGCSPPGAIDFAAATIDFLLSALCDAEAAKRLFRKALSPPYNC